MALAGIGAWVWSETQAKGGSEAETHGEKSPIVQDTDGNVEIKIGNGLSEEPQE